MTIYKGATRDEVIALAHKVGGWKLTELLEPELDANGVNIIIYGIPEEGGKLSVLWYVKVIGQETPKELWLTMTRDEIEQLREYEGHDPEPEPADTDR